MLLVMVQSSKDLASSIALLMRDSCGRLSQVLVGLV